MSTETNTSASTAKPITTSKSRGTKRRKTKIEKEIIFYQETDKPLIPVSCMKRLGSEILKSHGSSLRITKEAQVMLQAEAENLIVQKLEKANKLALICKRDTVTAEDLKNVKYFEK